MKPVDEEQELARLLASEASPLGTSISALRERGPDATELGLLASRLSLRGIAVSVPPTPPAAAPKPWKPWLLAGGGGAAAGLLWLALRGVAPAPVQGNDAEARARAQAQALEAQGPQGMPKKVEAQGNVSGKPAPSSAAPLPAASEAPAPDSAPPLAERAKVEASLPPSEALPTHANETVAERATPTAAARTTAQPSPGATPAPGPSSVPGAPTEIELLRDARLALRQSPAAALAFAEQHTRLYPQGKLSQEREFIAISALAASGRRTAALSRAARFEQAFPTSPYRKQLAELLK